MLGAYELKLMALWREAEKAHPRGRAACAEAWDGAMAREEASAGDGLEAQEVCARRAHSNGLLVEQMGWLKEAMATYQRALAIQEKAYGPDHAEVAITLTNMGVVLQTQGQLEEATLAYTRAQGIFVAQLGSEHPHTRQCRKLMNALRRDT